MKLSNKQNAPKNSKSSAQQSEVINTSPYSFIENMWGVDDEGLAHLHVNESKDSESIQALNRLFKETADGVIEPYWDASGHKRYRHHDGHFVTGLVINDKTYWFGGDCLSNLLYVTHVNKSGQEIWSKAIDLHKHVNFYCYAAGMDYLNLAIEIWETIKNENKRMNV